MRNLWRLCCIGLVFLSGCNGREIAAQTSGGRNTRRTETVPPLALSESEGNKLVQTLAAAAIPDNLSTRIESQRSTFLSQLKSVLANDDMFLRLLVDKHHSLPDDYEPGDLVELRYGSYRAGIADVMMLRQKAEAALEEIASAAKKEGLTVTVSSAYRSWQYQVGSFDRWTKRLGLKEAERVSARPGRSQHQLGLVVDFGSISNEFASSAAGKWIAANASRFGWSLSYPKEYEALTGYAWESWHYRYVGPELAAFIDDWFDGIQQYALCFIHEWEGNP